MWDIALLEDLPNELTHTGGDEDELYLSDRVFEDLAKFSLVDQFAITVFRLKEQVAHLFFSHQLHTCFVIIKTVARDMQAAWPHPNHLDKVVLSGYRLLKSYLLV